MLAVTSHLKFLYLAHFSKPSGERVLYRAIRRHRVRRIVELGLGTAQRARRMIELAARQAPAADVQYTGIDLFEARAAADGPGLPLKAVHQTLATTGTRVRLCPGDPFGVLSRTANSLGQADLVVISSVADRLSLQRAWFFLPRILHSASRVYLQEEPGAGQEPGFRPVAHDEIELLASAAAPRRAA